MEAHTTAAAPSCRATEMAAVIPRSLNDPVGLSPSTLSQTSPWAISDSQPVAFVQPSPLPAAPAAAATAGSRSYTVKKGDTLFSIAKTQLGSGRDWQKIVAINPGLSPQKLRVGQQIVLPS